MVQRIVQESQSFVPSVPPDFKPTGKYNPIPLDQLPKEKQAQIRAEIAAAQAELARQEQGEALGEPGKPLAIQTAFDQAQRSVEIFDDSSPPPAAAKAAPVATASPAASVSPTGADAANRNCPHCGWDQAVLDDVSVESTDKMVFLHASLGDVPFEKIYSLYDGGLKITFRTLTSFELDAIYKAVSRKVESDELQLMQERWEMINRFRLALQIKRVDRPDKTVDFPDGYDADTNPGAKTFWSQKVPAEQSLAPMDWIELHVRSVAMRNESTFRIIQKACGHFGRLVGKLEEMADTPDFWEPTGASS
jgi:hypothetical protein